MKRFFIVITGMLGFMSSTLWAKAPISEDTETCLDCHKTLHPGIVEDWKQSRHAVITPAEAMKAKGLALKVSSQNVPGKFKDISIGCAECHTLRPQAHKDTFDHNEYNIHVVVSPKDCATCHAEEAEQFDRNLMAHAHGNLVHNSVYQHLVRSINSTLIFNKGKIELKNPHPLTGMESCLYCHGTKLEFKGLVTRETDAGELEFPVIEGWPNQGTGRINLDGSRGACSACHTRHKFSIEMARKPYTCKECHVGPDVPAYKVYEASKHGNIYSAHNKDKYWDFKSVPWKVGKDFVAPTCATCHISLLVNTDGDLIVERSHDVISRLPYRIFGLIYAHPHPKTADTTIINNKDELQLPTDFGGGHATKYLVADDEKNKRRLTMQATCMSCHDRSWVERHWVRFENTIKQTNEMTLTATRIMKKIWEMEYAAGLNKKMNPFDEYIEKKWCDNWLFYANSIRFASAMAGGGDFGVFANGRYHISKNVMELREWLLLRQKTNRDD